MSGTEELAPAIGIAPACRAMSVSRATFYRRRRPARPATRPKRPTPDRALSEDERAAVLATLDSDRFSDKAPAEIQATLLDEGTYLCSTRTMYRVLAAAGQVRERRDQLRHPSYKKPELVATGPNQVWSWDITKLRGPGKASHFSLYVVIDIFSRYVTGWLVAPRESALLAERLMRETCAKENVLAGTLTIHADRGSSMTSTPLGLLLADLGVTKTHSRPRVSNDNPYSESQFKTLKYRPEFPDRFGSIEDARAFCRRFFAWYNREHRHSGIAMLTPDAVHHGRGAAITERRRVVLARAYEAHPERFVRKPPEPPAPPESAWINRPELVGGPEASRATPEAVAPVAHEAPKPLEPVAVAVGPHPEGDRAQRAGADGGGDERKGRPCSPELELEV